MKNFLKEIRRDHGLSLEMLAERTDYAISTINNFENDKTEVSTRFVETMAKALNVAVSEIWEGPATPSAAGHAMDEPKVKYHPLTPRLANISALTWREASETAEIPTLLGGRERNLFLMAVETNQLAPRVMAGDRLIFNILEAPENGDIVLARFRSNRKTLIRFYQFNSRKVIHLTTALIRQSTPDYSEDDFEFIYPAIELFRGLRA